MCSLPKLYKQEVYKGVFIGLRENVDEKPPVEYLSTLLSEPKSIQKFKQFKDIHEENDIAFLLINYVENGDSLLPLYRK